MSEAVLAKDGELLGRYRGAMLPLFNPARVLTHGEGAVVFDADGNAYLDLLGGIAVNALGHNHPAVVKAASEQVARAIHVSNIFASPQQIALAEKLLVLADAPAGSGVFFTNSGTESNEAAFKIARRVGKPRILALDHSFHGRTMGALALTSKEAYRAPFAPLPGGVEFIEANNVAALEAELNKGDVAAVFAEPIQGEAGVLPLTPEYMKALRDLTRKNGALLVFDEVQTGVARTGAWFAHQRFGVQPDVMTLAKGLGGGYPMGAVITFGEEVSNLLSAGQHGTTFGGNPLGAAISLAVLETIEKDNLIDHVNEIHDAVQTFVSELGSEDILGVRGAGLLLGIRFAQPVATKLVELCLDAGYIVNAPDATTLRLAPPLIISKEQILQFFRDLPDLVEKAKNSLEGDK